MTVSMLRCAGARVAAATVLLGAALVPQVAVADSDAWTTDALEAQWHGRVAGTFGRGLNIRTGPGQEHAVVSVVREGTWLSVLDGPLHDLLGRDWYLVAGFDEDATEGWCVGQYLVEVHGARAWTGGESGAEGRVGRSFLARLTAYTNQPPGNGAHGTITRSGTPVRWGVVAVDPSVIPLGSQLLIDGFDEVFVAEDTGGGVRGNHVDIYFPDYASAIRFGVQYRTITVLDG